MDPVAPRPVPFSALEGWRDDDHAAAFSAFRLSCAASGRRDAAAAAALALGQAVDRFDARNFFETYFEPQMAVPARPGFVTGYYEPEVYGSRKRSARFQVPVYARPHDLILTAGETERGQFNGTVTGFRPSGHGNVPYYTRAEIEAGALNGRGLELLYVEDRVELFYLQVQGSGFVRLEDGTSTRLSYAGKNGHPYTSIAQVLIERGDLAPDAIDMETIKAWLYDDGARARALMHENQSYVFFRELEDPDGPVGAEGIKLSPGRSLAIDTAHHALGTPVFVSAFDLDATERPFRRLMIAQDVGSAITGQSRGDIFFGTGAAAGTLAGRTRHEARFHVLMPKRCSGPAPFSA